MRGRPQRPASQRVITLPKHDHSRDAEGGKLASTVYARLDATSAQTFAAGLVIPGVDMSGGACVIPNPVTTPLQAVANGFIHLFGMVTTTDARTINDPDASGTRVLSKTLVALEDKATTQTGNVLVAPGAGHYLIFVQIENVTALAAGTVLAAIAHTGRGGALSQSPLPALTLTTRGVQSFFVLCKVASGDITYSFTVAAAVGTPSFDASVVPLGRIA